MLLQAPFHAVDAAPSNLQAPVDGRRVEARFQQLLDVLLHVRWLLAGTGHLSRRWGPSGFGRREGGC